MCFSATKCFAPPERGGSSGLSWSINIRSRWDRAQIYRLVCYANFRDRTLGREFENLIRGLR